ncbi:MAG: hypothetical protein JSR37_08750 [Verrucomicrobia bacterium]|nr:hypothetical protein [Verrucomicrobiota bacterium]MBS0636708.1 hypothetical protein [Verrucomicrobiota bacterium]
MSLVDLLPSAYYALSSVYQLTRTQHAPTKRLKDTQGLDYLLDDFPKLTEDLAIQKKKGFHTIVASSGTNLPSRVHNQALIIVNQELYEVEPEGIRFFVRIEMHLLEGNYSLKGTVIKTVVSLATLLFWRMEESSLLLLAKAGTLFLALGAVDKAYCERKLMNAIEFAVKKSSAHELQGALTIIAGVNTFNQEMKTTLTNTITRRLTSLHQPRSADMTKVAQIKGLYIK